MIVKKTGKNSVEVTFNYAQITDYFSKGEENGEKPRLFGIEVDDDFLEKTSDMCKENLEKMFKESNGDKTLGPDGKEVGDGSVNGAPIPQDEINLFGMQFIKTDCYKTTSPDLNGQVDAYGLIIAPKTNEKLPMISWQHGTQLMRKYAPSNIVEYIKKGKLSDIKTYFLEETMVALLVAAKGYIVVIPDYQGMMDNTSDCIHPYCVAKPQAQSVGDLLLHVVDHELTNNNLNWNNTLFLAGYSQGGFVTMVASDEIQNNPKYSSLKIKASAPAAGPYSLSEVMRDVMISNKKYGACFFLPMTMQGYNAAYPKGPFSKDKTFKKEFWEAFDLTDGYHSPEEIEKAMAAAGSIPRNVLSDTFIEDLKSENSEAHNRLTENDAFNWELKPLMPMQLYHSVDDELVPYKNSLVAQEGFKKNGYIVPIIEFKNYHHVGAFLPCVSKIMEWFGEIKKQNGLDVGMFNYQADGSLVCTI